MNITRENIDDLNAVITLKITEEDYTQKVEDVLKDYKKKARIDGFRPGMVPLGLVKKLYYKPVLAEEINKLVSEKLLGYIRDEKIRILGEPLPHKNVDNLIDFDKDKEFEFSFDIGLYPEFKVAVAENDKIPFYKIKTGDDETEKALTDIANRYGEMVNTEEISDEDVIEGDIFQSDLKGNRIENAISTDDVSISLRLIEDDTVKKKFIGKKTGEIVSFNLKKAFTDTARIKNLLKLEKDKEDIDFKGTYTLNIKNIKRFKGHEINQELFDKVYGEGVVKSMEEFRNRIKEEISASYARESDYRFTIDARDYYLKKVNLILPVEFLKRWLIETNEKLSKEEIEKDFKEYEDDFKWQLIRDQIVRTNEIKISEQEIQDYALNLVRSQFYGYGMYNVPEEYLEKYSREQLANPDSSKKIYDQRLTEKVFSFIRETVKAKVKEVTPDQFKKLFE